MGPLFSGVAPVRRPRRKPAEPLLRVPAQPAAVPVTEVGRCLRAVVRSGIGGARRRVAFDRFSMSLPQPIVAPVNGAAARSPSMRPCCTRRHARASFLADGGARNESGGVWGQLAGGEARLAGFGAHPLAGAEQRRGMWHSAAQVAGRGGATEGVFPRRGGWPAGGSRLPATMLRGVPLGVLVGFRWRRR